MLYTTKQFITSNKSEESLDVKRAGCIYCNMQVLICLFLMGLNRFPPRKFQ